MTLDFTGTSIWNESNLSTATAFQQTTMEWVLASVLISTTRRVKAGNAARAEEYETAFKLYSAAMGEHPELNNQIVPVPAFACIVQVLDGYPQEIQSTERVCPTKVYTAPKPLTLGTGLIGNLILGDWFVCLPGDTTPNGAFIPGVSKDGISGLFQKVASPIQSSPGSGIVLGWYQKKG